ncbi:MAG TPA: family 10 glycosylhydrolase [Rubricoccaceae bacterium]
MSRLYSAWLVAAALVVVSGCQSHRATIIYTNRPAPPSAGPAAPVSAPVEVDDMQPTLDVAGLPGPTREFRGAWVATVANIDWPSRQGMPAERQQAELVAILDRAVEIGLNAVVLQVRPAADALYASDLEPWSAYLTGREGEAPGYDPLAFAVQEAHARGLQLHAWANPFRASMPGVGRHDAAHVTRAHPEWTVRYGDLTWLDPGQPAAVDHSLAVLRDLVTRYDIDGLHLDDYFYPYPVAGADFPDAASYRAAQAQGETLGRADWRRQNVNRFVERLYGEVRAAKPDVLLGLSPFGIWRPGSPAGITGFDAYAGLYADARLWLREGWLDYLAPQLYWSRDSRGQGFDRLLGWWGGENTQGRHLWPGLFDSRTMPDVGTWRPAEIVGQVESTRTSGVSTGVVHYSFKSLVESRALGGDLAEAVYSEPALVPPSPWLDAAPPPAPRVSVEARRSGREVTVAPRAGETVRHFVVRMRRGGVWNWQIAAGDDRTHAVPAGIDAVAVSAVDRAGNESPATVVEVAP